MSLCSFDEIWGPPPRREIDIVRHCTTFVRHCTTFYDICTTLYCIVRLCTTSFIVDVTVPWVTDGRLATVDIPPATAPAGVGINLPQKWGNRAKIRSISSWSVRWSVWGPSKILGPPRYLGPPPWWEVMTPPSQKKFSPLRNLLIMKVPPENPAQIDFRTLHGLINH